MHILGMRIHVCMSSRIHNDLFAAKVWNTVALRDLPAEKRLFALALAARERLDICLSQCLAAVVCVES